MNITAGMKSRGKIALIGYRLNKGGSERVMSVLSHFFENQGLEVYIFIVLDDVAFSYSGKLINLGKLKNKTNGLFNKVNRLRALKKEIDEHQFDFIIDFRFRIKFLQEFILSRCIYNAKTIYTVHSAALQNYMPKQKILTQLIYKNSYKVVAITSKMQELIKTNYKLDNLARIYNPADMNRIKALKNEPITMGFEFVISAGQLNTNEKQFDKLIKAYSQSILPSKGIALVILGDGLKRNELVREAEALGVGDLVHFLGFIDNPYKYFSRAKCFLLTSLYEGMPMVLIESLACGTPVIAFDCPTGPNEIIQDKKNGLLIENQNIEAFTEGMNLILNNTELYNLCKENSVESVERFSLPIIGKQWMDLMNYN
ncbi:glycosyltransferase [Tamlana agarivorans]|uniref:Glycosyltransferase n=1 Tax=Pseudotamlana agarivorans TaxID=481183 RepID=A0ACC5U787_9FLAO|nr:glycosyltransferase [Tamlana agarivorans]MBU2950184.1 glycosyltransferase [Tamlana agarivorans]